MSFIFQTSCLMLAVICVAISFAETNIEGLGLATIALTFTVKHLTK